MTTSSKPRFLIQQKDTGLFFKHPDQWVPQRTQATDYGTSSSALETRRELRLEQVHFVIDFGDPHYDVQIEW